jgi:hypothetical protein
LRGSNNGAAKGVHQPFHESGVQLVFFEFLAKLLDYRPQASDSCWLLLIDPFGRLVMTDSDRPRGGKYCFELGKTGNRYLPCCIVLLGPI